MYVCEYVCVCVSHGCRLTMFRTSTTMDRSFMDTAASRALCADKRSLVSGQEVIRLLWWAAAHLNVVAGPDGPDRLQVALAAAQHHTHSVVTFVDLCQSAVVGESAAPVVGWGLQPDTVSSANRKF